MKFLTVTISCLLLSLGSTMRAGHKMAGPPTNEAEVKKVERVFKTFDKNKDKVISAEEAAGHEDLFEAADENGDGEVTPEEAVSLIEERAGLKEDE